MWQRLGVIASVLWIFGAVIWEDRIYERRHAAAFNSAIRACQERTGRTAINCYIAGEDEVEDPPRIRTQFWSNALLPILFGWLLAYPLIWIVRWVLAGRENSN